MYIDMLVCRRAMALFLNLKEHKICPLDIFIVCSIFCYRVSSWNVFLVGFYAHRKKHYLLHVDLLPCYTLAVESICLLSLSKLVILFVFLLSILYFSPKLPLFKKKNSKLHLRWYVHVLWLLTFRALYFCQNFLLNLFRIFRNVSRLCQMFPRFQTLRWNSLGLRLLSRMAPLKFIFPNVFFVSLFINFSIVDETEVLADSCRSFLFWQHIFVFYVLLS